MRSSELITCRGITSTEKAIYKQFDMVQLIEKSNTTEPPISIVNILDKWVSDLSEQLEENCTITSLDLTSNTISEEAAKHIAEALKENSSIISLTILTGSISENAAKHITEALEQNTAITKLKVIGTDLSSSRDPFTIRRKVRLLVSDEINKYFAKMLRNNSTLKSLTLKGFKIGDETGKLFVNALKQNIAISKLKISDISISREVGMHFAEMLRENTTLKSLHLKKCNIDSETVNCFADALRQNTSLSELEISSIPISREVGNNFAEMLKVNSTLKCLSLKKCNIGDDIVRNLTDALKQNFTLNTLNLSANSITEIGAKFVDDMLDQNYSLTFVCLYNNQDVTFMNNITDKTFLSQKKKWTLNGLLPKYFAGKVEKYRMAIQQTIALHHFGCTDGLTQLPPEILYLIFSHNKCFLDESGEFSPINFEFAVQYSSDYSVLDTNQNAEYIDEIKERYTLWFNTTLAHLREKFYDARDNELVQYENR